MNNIYFNKKYPKILLFFLVFFTFVISFNFCLAKGTNETASPPTLYCNNNLVMDAETGNILFEKNGYSKIYPASTTKVLTSILVLENLKLDEKVVASKKAINSIPIGSSVMGIKAEEIFSVENLLYGLMLPSRK